MNFILYIHNRCTKLSDCNTNPQIWSTETAECPGVEDVMPSLIYTHQLDDVRIYINKMSPYSTVSTQ